MMAGAAPGGAETHPAPGGRTPAAGWRLRLSDQRLTERRWTRTAMWVLVPLLITLFSWHPLDLQPGAGLDDSWHAALHMAVNQGITFGNHLIFTYGPLGFLSVPTLWYAGTGVIAVFYTLLLRVAIAAAVFAGARRTYGTAPGALIALLVAGAIGANFKEELPTLGLETIPYLIFSVWVVDRVAGRRRLLVLMALGGAIAGLELLNKLSVGLTITVLTLIMALSARGRRRENLAASIGGLLLALLAGWIVTGQSLGALPAFVRGSAQIVSGYGLGSVHEEAGLGWQYAAGAAAFAFGLLAALHATADGGGARRRWGIVALWVAFCFFGFKESFVRHDHVHAAIYFVALLGGFLALRWRGRMRLLGLGLTVALLVFALIAEQSSPAGVFDPFSRAGTAFEQLGQVLSPAERSAIMARGRAKIEAETPIDQGTLGLLEDKTVHVEPFESSVVWAYGLHWRPLPVFQAYSAYTTALDEDNAKALSSQDAPQRILRNQYLEEGSEADARVEAFNEPLATRELLCRYQELRVTHHWQVLGLGPNRCRAPVLLSTVQAAWGESVTVPAPPVANSFVFARISGVGVGGLERLTALLYRPSQRKVQLEGIPHLLVAGTAADGLILRAPPEVDFSFPYNIAPGLSSIAVRKGKSHDGGGSPITFSFYAQTVTAGPRDRALRRAIIGAATSPPA